MNKVIPMIMTLFWLRLWLGTIRNRQFLIVACVIGQLC